MAFLAPGYTLHKTQGLDTIPARVFHDIARLRQEVFVVEQDCVYLDLDGRDTEPTTVHYWVAAESGATQIAATLRVLDESAEETGLCAIGRVATSATHRGKALATKLIEAVIADLGEGPLMLHAQSYLTEWYARFGFRVIGAEYLEDGIPHTPMRRDSHGQP